MEAWHFGQSTCLRVMKGKTQVSLRECEAKRQLRVATGRQKQTTSETVVDNLTQLKRVIRLVRSNGGRVAVTKRLAKPA